MGDEIKVLKNKEVSDALHMLLHCALKDKEYETQKEQFNIVYSYIEQLEKEIEKKEQRLIITREAYNKVLLENAKLEDETKNSIPKEAIREKLQEVDNQILKVREENRKFNNATKEDYMLIGRRDVLKELLGE